MWMLVDWYLPLQRGDQNYTTCLKVRNIGDIDTRLCSITYGIN